MQKKITPNMLLEGDNGGYSEEEESQPIEEDESENISGQIMDRQQNLEKHAKHLAGYVNSEGIEINRQVENKKKTLNQMAGYMNDDMGLIMNNHEQYKDQYEEEGNVDVSESPEEQSPLKSEQSSPVFLKKQTTNVKKHVSSSGNLNNIEEYNSMQGGYEKIDLDNNNDPQDKYRDYLDLYPEFEFVRKVGEGSYGAVLELRHTETKEKINIYAS